MQFHNIAQVAQEPVSVVGCYSPKKATKVTNMHKTILSVVLLALSSLIATAQQESNAPAYTAISVSGFSDSIGHYQHDDAHKDYPRYAPEEIDKIAANILLYQRNNGGWPKNWDPLRILPPDEQEVIRNEKDLEDLPDEVKNTMLFVPVKTIDEALTTAFLPSDAPADADALV